MNPESRQDSRVTQLSRVDALLGSVNGAIRSPIGRLAAAGSALALVAGVATERADAEPSLDIAQVCIGPNTAQTTLTIKDYTPRDIEPTRVEVAYSASLDEFGSPPSRPWPLVTGRTLSELLSSSRPANDGVATPAYNGEALYSGTTTIISRNLPNGPQYLTTYLSWVNPDFPDTGYGRSQTTNPALDCSLATNPGGTVVPPESPSGGTPPVASLRLLNLGLKLNMPQITPKGRKANLTVKSEVKADSTCSIDGAGNGASKNDKLRKRAARVEVSLQKTIPYGRLPKGMIGLRNGKLPKKGKAINMVSIDLRNSGLKPGESQVSKLPYRLVKNAKSGGFSAKLFVPSGSSDCGSKTVSSKASTSASK